MQSSCINGLYLTHDHLHKIIYTPIDENNVEVARTIAAGSPKTFTMLVPIGRKYRIYLIEDVDTLTEKIFPFYYGTHNVFKINSVATIALGFIDTRTGKATPANNPLLATGVSGEGENKSVPESLTSATPPSGATLSALNNTGLDLLSHGSILRAKAYFKAAVENYPGDSTNDGDTANFFYALTRTAGVNLYSSGNIGALNSVADILDRRGCSPGGRSLADSAMVCPQTLPAEFPTGSELQIFLYNVIRPELEGAIANLNNVSSAFTKTWTESWSGKTGQVHKW